MTAVSPAAWGYNFAILLAPRLVMKFSRVKDQVCGFAVLRFPLYFSEHNKKVAAMKCAAIVLSMGMIVSPARTWAQRGGGGHGAPMTGMGGGVAARPDGVEEKDDLKDFHRLIEVQATSDQAAAFREIVKNTEAMSARLTTLEKENDAVRWAAGAAEVKGSIEKVRTQTRNFLEALSAKQKAGLKEAVGKVEKAESELGAQEKVLDASGGEGRAGGQSLQKRLESFRNQQDRLALEMGIVLAESEVAFRVPAVKATADVGGERIEISTSGVISRAAGTDVYKVESRTDLSELETSLTDVLSAQINAGPRCGERVEVRDAALEAAAPVSVVTVQLYVERWACTRGMGETELAQGNGSVEVKVTPVVGTNGEVTMKTELGRVEADKFLEELVTSGLLGSTLREKVGSSMERVIEGADLKAMLPAAAGTVKIERARFDNATGGNVGVVVEGELKMSDEQATLVGNQLRERLAAAAGAKPEAREAAGAAKATSQ